jgi:hypothetical protein
MNRGGGVVSTAAGLAIIAVMAVGCLVLVSQLRHYVALADTLDQSDSGYINGTYGFRLNLGEGWPRLSVIEKKESEEGAESVVRRLYFLLPTQDAYYMNGFAHPLVVGIYTKADAERLGLAGHPRLLGASDQYTFIYQLWEEAPSDLTGLTPSPAAVVRSFELLP